MYMYRGSWIIYTTWTFNDHTGPASLVEHTTNSAYARAMVRRLNHTLLGG